MLTWDMSRDLNVDQIKKLWLLDLIIRAGSLRKAALHAKISASAVSQSLSSLEHSVGKPLLIRNRGTVTPTQTALDILKVVRPAFDAFDRLRELNRAPLPQMTWLNFGTYESIAIDILPGLLQSVVEKMPHLKLSLRVSRTANLLTMVRKGELCSALVTEVDELDRFRTTEVARDRLGLFVAKNHPVAVTGWRALDEIGFGSLAPGRGGLPRYFAKYMRQLEPRRPVVLSDSFETLRACASAGNLVAVLPRRVAMRSGDLSEIVPPRTKVFKETGEHKIYVVSLANCDPAETDFLAAESRRLLETRAHFLAGTGVSNEILRM